ncbi:hypothetical protein ACWEPC_07350 [Nonomuraea sp. NPDC004297]
MPEAGAEEWPCYFSDEMGELMADPRTSAELFSAIAALSVRIHESRGELPAATASDRWPQQRRVALGEHGVLGVAEYVINADAPEPHCLITRVQPF